MRKKVCSKETIKMKIKSPKVVGVRSQHAVDETNEAFKMFRFVSTTAEAPELEVRGPRAPLASKATSRTENKNENKAPPKIKETTFENSEGKETFDEEPTMMECQVKTQDAKPLGKDVEMEEDVKNLSKRAESRAEQLAVANAVDSVKSELEQTGAVNTTLREGRFKKIVAPVKKEDSNESFKKEIKARIPNQRAEEGRGQEMPSYMIKQLITSPSNKADDANPRALRKNTGEPREKLFVFAIFQRFITLFGISAFPCAFTFYFTLTLGRFIMC